MLLEAGADPNLQAIDGKTALMVAAANNHEGIARQLLEAGADPSVKNLAGETAADIAARIGYERLVELLRSNE